MVGGWLPINLFCFCHLESGSLPTTVFSFLINNYLKVFCVKTELGDNFSKAKEQPATEIGTCSSWDKSRFNRPVLEKS